MSQLSQPAFGRGLEALAGLIRKGQDFAASRKLDDAVLLQARLFPDMLPLVGQVQRASDSAKGAIARLSGVSNPSFADTETTFAEVQDRIARTLDFVRSAAAGEIDGSEERLIEVKAQRTLTFTGQQYLLGFALPNFYFHIVTAHGILRHNGVGIGKLDYFGRLDLARDPE